MVTGDDDNYNDIHQMLLIQGVYNCWKYWKSPGILLILLEKFILPV